MRKYVHFPAFFMRRSSPRLTSLSNATPILAAVSGAALISRAFAISSRVLGVLPHRVLKSEETLSEVPLVTLITGASPWGSSRTTGRESPSVVCPIGASFEAASSAKLEIEDISLERSEMLPFVLISRPPLLRVTSTCKSDLGGL